MPFIIRDLINGRAKPLSVKPTDLVQQAIELMTEHNYSQLPVVDDAERPQGMITGDSVLRALGYFNITLSNLRVSHALTKADIHRDDDDLFEVLDDLQNSYAVLIVDNNQKLKGIFTGFDAAEYFRRRAEDMMLVEDVETMLREYILSTFTDSAGTLDRDALDAFVNNTVKPPKAFEKLTLYNYIELFVHKDRWKDYGSSIGLEAEVVGELLHGVRNSRNTLAHFRDELTAKQRDQLRFCADWLARHQPVSPAVTLTTKSVTTGVPVLEAPILGTADVVLEAVTAHGESTVVSPSVTPAAPEPSPAEEEQASDSRYTPLANYLQSQPADIDAVELTLAAIEKIIDDQLPPSARRHRSMWANDLSRPQARQWIDAGWRVSRVDLDEERIIFVRNKEYERAYLTFFATLESELELASPGMFSFMPSNGRYYLGLGTVAIATKNIASFFCAFTRTKRFRVELSIDTHDQRTTKQIFDALYERKERIEEEIGEKLSWERMNDSRPSRIARYYPGTINDTTGALANLRARAIEAARRVVPVLRRHIAEVVPTVLGVPVVNTTAETRR
jgi:CBS domain-containing protein